MFVSSSAFSAAVGQPLVARATRRLALVAILVVASLATLAGVAAPSAMACTPTLTTTSVTGSCFEGGDGNLHQNDVINDYDDWQTIPRDWKTAFFDESGQFTSSAEQDPSTWTIIGGEPNDKNNILAATSYLEKRGDETFLHAGFYVSSGNGSTNILVELNKLSVGQFVTPPGITPAYTGPLNALFPDRSQNDVLIQFSGNQGQTARIGLCRWVGSRSGEDTNSADNDGNDTYGWYQTTSGAVPPATIPNDATPTTNRIDPSNKDCTELAASIAVGRVHSAADENDGDPNNLINVPAIDAPNNALPATDDTPVGPFPQTMPNGTFAEMSINLTDALDPTGANPCFGFGGIWLHTYNGNSISSGMLDFLSPEEVQGASTCSISVDKKVAVNQSAVTPPPTGEFVDAPPSPSYANTGDYLWYRLAVTNTGQQTLDTINLTDPNCDLGANPAPIEKNGGPGDTTFSAGDTWTYLCKYQLGTIAADGLTRTNTVTATATRGTFTTQPVQDSVTTARRAKITIVKDATPNALQDFTFTPSGALGTTPVILDDDSGVTGADNTRASTSGTTFHNLETTGLATVAESAQSGWSLTNLVCANAAGAAAATVTYGRLVGGVFDVGPTSGFEAGDTTFQVDVRPGIDVTCTFSNVKDASVTYRKVTDPVSDPQDFTFDATGSGLTDATLDTDAASAGTPSQQTDTLTAAQLGAKTITETNVPSGWSLTTKDCTGTTAAQIAGGVSFTVSAGDTIVCTFTNVKGASVTYRKVTDPVSDPQDFTFDATGSGLTDATLDTDAASAGTPSQQVDTLTAAQLGAKTITETNVPSGWSLTAKDCTGTTAAQIAGGVSFTVNAGDTIVCTFTNVKGASVTYRKVTDPVSDPQDFTFDATGSGLTDATLDTDAASAGTPSQQTDTLTAAQLGAKTITETNVPSGWSLTTKDCTGTTAAQIAGGVSFTVAAGDTIVCTFTNVKGASVTYRKVTDPVSDPQDFTFDATGSGLTDATLDTDAASAGTPSQQTDTLTAAQLGAKTITETNVPSGWSLTTKDCTGTTAAQIAGGVSFTVAAGDTIVCTFTNVKGASVTYRKVTDPVSDPQDFTFDATGSGLTDATLDTDAASAGTPSQQTDTLTAAQLGAKTITETNVPSGWSLTTKDCTGTTAAQIAGGVSFTVAAGDTIVCTFTNVKDASVTYRKVTDPASDPQDFTFDATGSGLTDATLDTDAASAGTPSQQTDTLTAGQLGAKTITETNVPSGWSLTTKDCTGTTAAQIAGGVSFTVAAGDTIVCTFTNVKGASVTYRKVTDPASDPQDFTFDATGSGLTDATLDTDAASAGTPSQQTDVLTAGQLGAKTITETNVPSGWSLTTKDCTGTTAAQIAGGVSFTVNAGDTIVCTFTNVKGASVTYRKVTDPASDPQDFTFDATGSGMTDATLDTDAGSAGTPPQQTDVLTAAQLGAKTITETNVPSGWSLTTKDCTGTTAAQIAGGVSFTVAAGDTIVCTFTNVKDASVTYRKVTDPASDPQDFTFDATGSGLTDATLDTDAASAGTPSQQTDVLTAAQLGAKAITETNVPSGWSLTTKDCTGTTAAQIAGGVSFTVNAGDTIVCTFTNVKGASVTYRKVTDPASDPQDFTFDATGSGMTDATLDTDAGSAGTPPQQTDVLTAAQLGAKTITETNVPSGWSLTTKDCTGTTAAQIAGGVSFTVAAGDTIVCTFTNVKDASVTYRKVTDPASDPQDFTFDATGSGLTDATLDTDAASAGTPSQQTDVLTAAQLGAKAITETNVPSGWSLTTKDCTGTTAAQIAGGVSFTVSAGDTIVCTFTNVKDASVTYRKVTDPASDPQDFTFDATGSGLTDATLDTDAASAGTPSQQTDVLTAAQLGAKTITETNIPSNWTLTSKTCTGTTAAQIAGGVSFTVNAGDTIVCTFTNAKDATVTVVKQANPEGSTSFDFDGTGNGIPADIDLVDDGTSANTQVITLDANELAGTKTITETVPSDWSLTSKGCTGVSATQIADGVSFDTIAGANITCTFTNTKKAKVTIVKDAINNDAQDFTFAPTGKVGTTEFVLDDDAGAAGADADNATTKVFSGLTEFGLATVTEAGTPIQNWDLELIACVNAEGAEAATVKYGYLENGSFTTGAQDGSKDGFNLGDTTMQVDVQPGVDVTCTFTNKKVALNVAKLAVQTTPVNAGDEIGFTVETSNAGPGTARDVVLTDPLPEGVNWTIDPAYAGEPCEISPTAGTVGQVLTCTYGDLAEGATKLVRIVATTSFEACTVYDNTATATADNASPDESSASITCNKPAVSIEKTTSTGTISAGDDAKFAVTVTNAGPGTAYDVVISDLLPAGPTWAADGALPAGCVLADVVVDTVTRQKVTCTLATFAPGSFTFNVIAPTTFDECGTYLNTATGTGSNTGTIPSDDATVICKRPALEEDKAALQVVVDAGDDISFTMTTRNTGAGTAKGVVLNDPLPDGVNWSIVSQTNPGNGEVPAECSITGSGDDQVLTCSYGDLAPGAVREVTVKATTSFDACTVYNNTATASAANAPSDSDDASVACNKPSVSIEKSTSTGTINAGDVAKFAVKVSNGGPGAAKNVVISDPLPAGPTWSFDGAAPAGCVLDAQKVTCTLASMASGASFTFNVQATTTQENCVVYNNTATGTGSNTGPIAPDSATIDCRKLPAISIDKTGPATATAGDRINYALAVKNTGPTSYAEGLVVLTDVLCEAPPVLVSKGTDGSPATLDPGETWLYGCTVQTQVGQTVVNNVGVVNGTDVNGNKAAAQDGADTVLSQPVVAGVSVPVVPGTAKLRGPSGCLLRPTQKVYVTGKQILKVCFVLDKKTLRTVTKPDKNGRYAVTITRKRMKLGSHRVQAVVTFKAVSKTKPRTLQLRFSRCGEVKPARAKGFTG